MKTISSTALMIALLFTVNTYSQDTARSGLNALQNFIGSWKGEGKVTGLDSKVTMIWEPALGGQFVRLTFHNEMKDKNGKVQMFEGSAYYRPAGGEKFLGYWFDSGGEMHPIDAVFQENALRSTWGTRETKYGRTIYQLVENTKMEVTDSIMLKDGSWREFGRSVYIKQPDRK